MVILRVPVVPGIAPSRPTPVPTHPGYTPAADPGWLTVLVDAAGGYGGVNMVVGLKSVQQLTLGTHFSVLRTMTEVYNLSKIGNR